MGKQEKIAICVFLTIGIFCVLFLVYRNKELRDNGVIVFGRIIDHSYDAKSAVLDFKYSFLYKGKSFEKWGDARVHYSPDFIGKTFPVRYSPKPGVGEILITHEILRSMGFPFLIV